MRTKKTIKPESFEHKPRRTNSGLFAPAFSSKWPLEKGMVIKISSPVQDPGKRPGKYTQYIWIQNLLRQYPKKQKCRQPQYRPVRVTYCFIPQTDCINSKPRVQTKIVEARQIRRLMKTKGYEIFARNIHWRGDRLSIRRFYVLVGLLKPRKSGPKNLIERGL